MGVSKQTIQYHYQRLPTKDQQKDSQGKNLISPLAENIIKDRVSKPLLAKNHQNDSKEPTSDGATISATTKWETSHEPLDVYGKITAGIPTFADEHIIGQTIIPDDLIRRYGRDNLFALQVNGDSMSRVIAPGFIAVFAKDCEVENGDICAVLVDGENATLKRFKETSRAVILEPESFNPIYKPLIFPKNIDQDFRILGKYVFATSLLN